MRLRLTALYGGLFLVSGGALLVITYFLMAQPLGGGNPGMVTGQGAGGQIIMTQGLVPNVASGTAPDSASFWVQLGSSAQLHRLIMQGGIALGIMAVVSIGLGWLVAGRVLRPLRTMTATTREISEANLHERLSLEGPSDELKDLGDTIDGLLGRLQAAFDAQRRFIANASHELRTPLTMMRTSLDVAEGKPHSVPPEVNVLAGKLREGLDQADRLLEGLLALARAQRSVIAEGEIGDLTTVSLSRVVLAALEARQGDAQEMGLGVMQSLGQADVIGSETLLGRLADNLIDNAIRHNERGGWVRIVTEAQGGVARLIVENGGPILDETKVGELGQPFRRLHSDRTGLDKGVGLGLSIVASIAVAHGGSLDLSTRPEGGLRVIVQLPRAGETQGVVEGQAPIEAHRAGVPG